MAKKAKASKKGNWKGTTKKVLKITAGVLVGTLSLAGVISIGKNVKDKLNPETYVFTEKHYTTAGYIDDYGKYKSFDNAMQTNYGPQLTSDDYYRMDELKSITYEANKDYPLQFQVNLYGENNAFIETITRGLTEAQVKEYIETQSVVWFRVEIIPTNDANGEIDKSEMKKCVEQVVVTMWSEAPEEEKESDTTSEKENDESNEDETSAESGTEE